MGSSFLALDSSNKDLRSLYGKRKHSVITESINQFDFSYHGIFRYPSTALEVWSNSQFVDFLSNYTPILTKQNSYIAAVGITAGAFGSHGLKSRLASEQLDSWKIATNYAVSASLC